MKTTLLAAGIGAEIHGVDLSKPMPESTFTYVRDAWLDHGVLLFRDQHLNHAQHIAFSKLFGELDDHSSIPKFRDPVHHEILRVTNDVVSGRKQTVGRQWHSDLSITLQPARGSILRCEALPPVGGDTMFANTYKAFESLSAPLQHMLENMEAIHDISISKQNKGRTDLMEARTLTPPVAQPIVRRHPETGRKTIYVNEMSTSKIVGMTDEESAAILKLIFENLAQPENVYRPSWKVGDVLMWDNCCTQHIALGDYDINVPRIMYRTTVMGPKSGRLAVADDWV